MDFIIYFGPLEFLLFTLSVIALSGGLTWAVRHWRANRAAQYTMQQLLHGLPYPALYFRNQTCVLGNTAADEWQANLDVAALVKDSLKLQQNILRTIPAVEGQTFQARALRLAPTETLVLLEDLGAAQRQQAFYRNFIQNVSHELKTPLTVIQGHAAKMGDAPNDQASWQASRRIIADEAKRLTQLVDNLLTLARLESPAFTLDRAPLNLSALLEDAILQVSDLAEQRGLALNLNLTPGLPRLEGDRARLKQVLLNLLDNALKYTPAGGSITVAGHVEARSTGRVVVCALTDTGEGIPPEDVPYIFDKLYRARRAGKRPVEGSGLGLTLAQHIIRAHGGEVSVQSTLGQGTTFTFTLPCK